MDFADLLRRYQAGTLSGGTAVLFGAVAAVLALLAAAFLVKPLVRFFSRKDIEKVFQTRMRRVGTASLLASASLGVFVACRGWWPPELRLQRLPYEVSELLLIVSAGYLALEVLLSLFGDWLPRVRGQSPLAPIMKDLIRLLALLAVALLGVKATFPSVDIAALITTSAILSVVVGLALQESLSNVFSGIMLTIDRPFKPGDWIQIDDEEGKVLDSNWRSTRVQTRDDDLIYVPNSTMAKANITNLSDPTTEHLVRTTVGVEYNAPPNKVRNVFIAMMNRIDGVLTTPPPDVYIKEYGESAIEYELRFWINDYDRVTRIEAEVMRAIWYHLKRAGISIPFPQQEIYLKREKPVRTQEDVVGLLQRVDIFAPLKPEEYSMLAEDLSHLLFARGEAICKQGDVGSTFYIIKSGLVAVRVKGADGVEAEVARLNPGSYFGEMSLLTGDVRSSTCVAVEDSELLCLDRESFEVLLHDNPAVAQAMSEILAARSQATKQRLSQERETKFRQRTAEEDSGSRKILEKIWTIFRFKK